MDCRVLQVTASWVEGRGRQQNRPGGAHAAGNRLNGSGAIFALRWSRILLITTASSMQAMIRTEPPEAELVSMSKTRCVRRLCTELQTLTRADRVPASGRLQALIWSR